MKLLFCDTLHAPSKSTLYPRLEVLSEKLHAIVRDWKPDEVAIEDIFASKNARSAFLLGVARGVAVGACLGKGLKIFEYPPATVKMIVTGYGRADKEQVQKMVRLTLGFQTPMEYDTTDALAVAICHANSTRIKLPG